MYDRFIHLRFISFLFNRQEFGLRKDERVCINFIEQVGGVAGKVSRGRSLETL